MVHHLRHVHYGQRIIAAHHPFVHGQPARKAIASKNYVDYENDEN